MGRRSNFNDEPDEQHRCGNFGRRLSETMGSELEPEQVTPNSAGAEELTEYEEVFPLTRQFNQTNMRTPFRGANRTGSDDQRQSKDRRKRTEERKSGSLG